MTEWQKVKLGDSGIEIIDGDRGKNYPSANEFFENGYCLFLNTKNVPHTCFDFSTCSFIDQQKDEKLRKGKLQFNDIVMTTRGTVGNFALYRSDCQFKNVRINSGMVIFRNQDERINTEFLNCLLSSNVVKGQIKELSSGSAQPQLPIRDINKIEIPLPPLDEQKRIAKILSSLDDKIENNNAINKNLEEQAQAIFFELFMDEIKTADNSKKVPLKDIVTVVDNRGKTPPCSIEKTDFPMIEVKALSGISRIIEFESYLKYVDENTYNLWFRSGHPQAFDILIATVGNSIGAMKIFLEEKGCIAQNVVALRSSISPVYLYQYLQYIKGEITAYDIGSAQPSIKVSHLMKYEIFLPSNGSLQKYHKIATSLTEKMHARAIENQKLSQLRDTLLPKLMSGEVRV